MKRDLNTLANTEYDLIVIGSGIYGANTAWDAALRGLKVALIEKDDFGGATSANSLKTIHGGLRYLQQLDFKRMRESIRERMILMRIAPQFVYPLRVVMPTYSYKMKSRPALMAALIANDIIGFDRNGLNDPHKYMPNGYTVSSKKVDEYIPGYTKYNLNGGAVWYDCQCYNTERMLLSFVHSAAEHGADVANYLKATELIYDGKRVVGVKTKDEFTGNTLDIRGKIVINSGGPWVDQLLASLNGKAPERKFTLSSAMNIVVKRNLLNGNAAGISGPYKYIHPDGSEYNAHRILFFSSWRDYTIIGTNHLVYHKKDAPEQYKVSEAEIQDFLACVNQAYPAAEIKRNEVTFFYGGFLPMAGQHPNSGEVQLEKHYQICDHMASHKIDGLITVVGVKYTTARDVAKKTIDLAFKKLGKKDPGTKTDVTPIYGGEINRFLDFQEQLVSNQPYKIPEASLKHLSYNYGSAYKDILQYAEDSADWAQLLPGSDEVLKAEVLHGVREEMAMKLSDIILRRTDMGSGEQPNADAISAAADIMAAELKWDDKRKQQEIDDVNQIYVSV
ncbi:glycerol-3-phosphate dehydrogenase/oxidase [candidate division KSB1 bacterium]|nr:glycerol-3-phosphate dehydrogenase/oxidase [candidate division KSB1 bacterium]